MLKCQALFCEKDATYKIRLPRTRRKPEEIVNYCKAHATGMVKYAHGKIVMELEQDKE